MGVGVQRHGDVYVAQAVLCVFGLHACRAYDARAGCGEARGIGWCTHRPSPGSSHLTYRDMRLQLLEEAVDILDVACVPAG